MHAYTLKAITDTLFSIGLIVNSLLIIPQIIKILKCKTTKNLSVITYTGFNIFLFGMAAHGYIARDLILTLGMGASLVLNSIVVMLIIIYRGK